MAIISNVPNAAVSSPAEFVSKYIYYVYVVDEPPPAVRKLFAFCKIQFVRT